MAALLGVVAASSVMAAILAAESSPLDPGNPVTWVSFGVAGIVTAAFVRGWVVPGGIYRAERDQRIVAETALRDSAPVLAKANETQGRMLDYLAAETRRGDR